MHAVGAKQFDVVDHQTVVAARFFTDADKGQAHGLIQIFLRDGELDGGVLVGEGGEGGVVGSLGTHAVEFCPAVAAVGAEGHDEVVIVIEGVLGARPSGHGKVEAENNRAVHCNHGRYGPVFPVGINVHGKSLARNVDVVAVFVRNAPAGVSCEGGSGAPVAFLEVPARTRSGPRIEAFAPGSLFGVAGGVESQTRAPGGGGAIANGAYPDIVVFVGGQVGECEGGVVAREQFSILGGSCDVGVGNAVLVAGIVHAGPRHGGAFVGHVDNTEVGRAFATGGVDEDVVNIVAIAVVAIDAESDVDRLTSLNFGVGGVEGVFCPGASVVCSVEELDESAGVRGIGHETCFNAGIAIAVDFSPEADFELGGVGILRQCGGDEVLVVVGIEVHALLTIVRTRGTHRVATRGADAVHLPAERIGARGDALKAFGEGQSGEGLAEGVAVDGVRPHGVVAADVTHTEMVAGSAAEAVDGGGSGGGILLGESPSVHAVGAVGHDPFGLIASGHPFEVDAVDVDIAKSQVGSCAVHVAFAHEADVGHFGGSALIAVAADGGIGGGLGAILVAIDSLAGACGSLEVEAAILTGGVQDGHHNVAGRGIDGERSGELECGPTSLADIHAVGEDLDHVGGVDIGGGGQFGESGLTNPYLYRTLLVAGGDTVDIVLDTVDGLHTCHCTQGIESLGVAPFIVAMQGQIFGCGGGIAHFAAPCGGETDLLRAGAVGVAEGAHLEGVAGTGLEVGDEGAIALFSGHGPGADHGGIAQGQAHARLLDAATVAGILPADVGGGEVGVVDGEVAHGVAAQVGGEVAQVAPSCGLIAANAACPHVVACVGSQVVQSCFIVLVAGDGDGGGGSVAIVEGGVVAHNIAVGSAFFVGVDANHGVVIRFADEAATDRTAAIAALFNQDAVHIAVTVATGEQEGQIDILGLEVEGVGEDVIFGPAIAVGGHQRNEGTGVVAFSHQAHLQVSAAAPEGDVNLVGLEGDDGSAEHVGVGRGTGIHVDCLGTVGGISSRRDIGIGRAVGSVFFKKRPAFGEGVGGNGFEVLGVGERHQSALGAEGGVHLGGLVTVWADGSHADIIGSVGGETLLEGEHLAVDHIVVDSDGVVGDNDMVAVDVIGVGNGECHTFGGGAADRHTLRELARGSQMQVEAADEDFVVGTVVTTLLRLGSEEH